MLQGSCKVNSVSWIFDICEPLFTTWVTSLNGTVHSGYSVPARMCLDAIWMLSIAVRYGMLSALGVFR